MLIFNRTNEGKNRVKDKPANLVCKKSPEVIAIICLLLSYNGKDHS